MNRSLYSKLVLIMILLIASIMLVVGAFLARGVRDFFLDEFYNQMRSVFSDELLADELRLLADEEDAPDMLATKLGAYAGLLGLDSGNRNYYILEGGTGKFLTGSDMDAGPVLEATPNMLIAIAGGDGSIRDSGAEYMDVALSVRGKTGSYIIYIKDNKERTRSLNTELFSTIIGALLAGLIISVLLSLVLAKTMVTPIQNLTRAAEKVAGGDFSGKPENLSRDEIGILTRTFNEMAGRLEKTLEDLKKSEAMRRDFVANVSHELRTPITSIRSYAETLEGEEDLPDSVEKEFLGVIVNESDRMTKIVQDLLTLSQFDVGSFEFIFEKFSFEKSVKDVYNAMLMEAQKRGHIYKLDIQSDIPEIVGDRIRVEQVLMNMISNAIKYTQNEGRVSVRAGSSQGYVWAMVQDNGMGIPQDDVEHVFERFYRVDKARSRESGGTGLGLAISEEIVSRHGGSLDLESSLGLGTTISLVLPIEAAPDA